MLTSQNCFKNSNVIECTYHTLNAQQIVNIGENNNYVTEAGQSSWEAEAGLSWVQGHPLVYSEL